MDEETIHRKLAAIFSADVAGYSRLMRDDEMATIRLLTEYRALMSTLIMQHKGRVVDSPGDNLLAEFASVVDAVQSSVAIQRELKARNAGFSENRRMEFRIGINIGDVIQEGDRIYGDGVNIAARLEGLAEPGGICISRTAYDQIESKLPLGYEYLGEKVVKNINKPLYAYRVVIDQEDESREKKGSEGGGGGSKGERRHSRHGSGGQHFERSFRQVKDHVKEFAKELKGDEQLAETLEEIKGKFHTFTDGVAGSPDQRHRAVHNLFKDKHLRLFIGITCFLLLINVFTSFGNWWFQYPIAAIGLFMYLHWVKNSFFSSDTVIALRQRLLQKELVRLEPEVPDTRKRRKRAKKYSYARVRFYKHLYIYAGVNAFLIIINLLTSPFSWWFPFPLLVWGIILFFHWMKLK